ncbi:MAG: methionine adenosyltransferase domain-containing protein, partial [Candidatus Peribacteraceae bacterium]|nr:methionine adenosyltransferase domain-containing protein [Candidatus Peribacteraceae bacterium]
DPSKVDRSAAYMARKIAVDVLDQTEHDEVMVKLAYAIGIAKPVMVSVLLINDGVKTEFELKKNFYDLTPNGIIKALDLKTPQYAKLASWGSFGNGSIWDR